MGKFYCILGRSAVGKSTVEKYLQQLGYDIVISTTTRPKRDYEIEGKDYFYVSDEEFDIKLRNNEFLESTIYNSWRYGVDIIHIDSNIDYVLTVEINGYNQLVEKLGKENVVPILLFTKPKTRLLRALSREENPNCFEICRRFLADEDLYNEFERKCEIQYLNDNSYNTAREIDLMIRGENF